MRRSELAQRRVLGVDGGGSPVVVWAVAGLSSALDTEQIADGRALSTTGAFHPVVAGRPLTFAAAGDQRFTDAQTGSTWDVLGRATGRPVGRHPAAAGLAPGYVLVRLGGVPAADPDHLVTTRVL